MSSLATSPYIGTTDIIRGILSFTAKDITRLKKTIIDTNQVTNEEDKNVEVITFEVLTAHVWRERCRALKLSPQGTIHLRIAVNIRNIMEPRLQKGYYGNALVGGGVTLTVNELSESTLFNVVKRIKDAKKMAMRKENVLEEVREIERRLKVKIEFGSVNESFLMIMTDWRHLGIDIDDLGELVNVIPLISVKGHNVCFVLPASKVVRGNEGGARVLVVLPKAAMAKFKEEINAY